MKDSKKGLQERKGFPGRLSTHSQPPPASDTNTTTIKLAEEKHAALSLFLSPDLIFLSHTRCDACYLIDCGLELRWRELTPLVTGCEG